MKTSNNTLSPESDSYLKQKIIAQYKTLSMETQNHNSDIVFNEDIYTIDWAEIENTDIDYENYLSDIENFFREDFKNDILEKDM